MAILIGAWFIARIDQNPIVQLEAAIGLSPSPLERLFGIRGPFSGMTEATFQLAHGELGASFDANLLTVPFLMSVGLLVLLWKAPVLATRRQEGFFAAVVVAATVVNNF